MTYFLIVLFLALHLLQPRTRKGRPVRVALSGFVKIEINPT